MSGNRLLITLNIISLFISALGYSQSSPAPLPVLKSPLEALFFHKLAGTDTAQWHSIDPNVLPNASASHADNIQFKIKLLDMMSFCTGEHFSMLSEVDAQAYLNVPEKKFCKERLKKLKPDLQ